MIECCGHTRIVSTAISNQSKSIHDPLMSTVVIFREKFEVEVQDTAITERQTPWL